jgi:hypothetical protein
MKQPNTYFWVYSEEITRFRVLHVCLKINCIKAKMSHELTLRTVIKKGGLYEKVFGGFSSLDCNFSGR